MNTSSQIIKRVEDAVYHAPYMIPVLFKECGISHGFLHSRLRRYVPHRVGIEFECFGDFANSYLKDHGYHWKKFDRFCHQFGLRDFSQETSLIGTCMAQKNLIDKREEIRVSICDYRQLSGLYSIMNEMAKYCSISDDCGIHIHIDLTKYDSTVQKKKAVKWFNAHLCDVESIFPPYRGSYNKRNCDIGKGNWINLSHHGTVEFRIAPLTFDYEELIVWIVKCSKLVSRMIRECRLDKFKAKSNCIDGEWLNELTPGISEDTTVVNFEGEVEVPGEGSDFEDGLRPHDPHLHGILERVYSIEEQTSRLQRYAICSQAIHESDQIFTAMVANDLQSSDIEWWIHNHILQMRYPDDMVARIAVDDAINAYLNGGIEGIIRSAITEEPPSTWTNGYNESYLDYTRLFHANNGTNDYSCWS